MVIELCTCDGLPAHEHVRVQAVRRGAWYMQETDDIERFYVDWKALAHHLWAEAVTP